jgi:hypothetical protein
MFWLALGVFLFSTALSYLTRPKNRSRVFAIPPKPGEFQRPTAEEGRTIPYLAGTVIIADPNVLWDGDYSTTAFNDADGNFRGYKYFLGAQYGICLGPIDAVLDVRFDDKILTSGISGIGPGLALKVNAATVALTSGSYATAGALAKRVTQDIAPTDPTTKVFYGFEIVAGQNDTLHFAASADTVVGPQSYAGTITLPAGPRATGTAMATLIGNTIWPGSADTLVCHYDEGTNKFTFKSPTGPGITSGSGHLTIYGDSKVLGALGFPVGADIVLAGSATLDASWTTFARRFFFSIGAGTTIYWTDSATNSHGLFGVDLAAPDSTVSRAGDFDRFITDALLSILPGADSTRISVNAPTLFGGELDEGGVVGDIDIFHGTESQLESDYLATTWGATPPAFRGLCYAVVRKLYQGNSPYMKRIAFAVERCPNTLGMTGSKHRIPVPGANGDDSNPACLLHELLTDALFGMGIPDDAIDLDSFRAAGETLHAEGLGMSLSVPDTATALDLIQEIMRHVDGVLFTDPETGRQMLNLIRDDVAPADMPVIDQTSAKWVRLVRMAQEQVTNVVKVSYTDRARAFTQRISQIQNLAQVQLLGRGETDTVDFSALTSDANARIQGERYLRSVSYPLARLEITADRSSWRLRPGQAFVLNWAPLGIAGMVCRVTRIRTGEIRDGAVGIEAVEDVYNLANATFAAFE